MAANDTIYDSTRLEQLRHLSELTTTTSRTELSDPLPGHLKDCYINDLQREYAARHKTKVRTPISEGEKSRDEVSFAEKFEKESSEKEITSITQHSLQDIRIYPSNTQTTVTPSQTDCSRNTHCTEPLVMVGHQLLANIRTIWTKMWILTSDDALASG